MRQLTFIRPGQFEWREVAAPVLRADTDAVVRPLAVARCDLDFYIATGFAPYAGPFAFGHEMVGEVVEAGDRAGVAPGDRVVVPFQLSCGRCDNCRRGLTNTCRAYRPAAGFGLAAGGVEDFGGALSDAVRVPFADHMLLPLPPGLEPAVAAGAGDNIADGWRTVAGPLQERPGGGASVLVVGGLAQSVSLYAVAAAVALGAARVVYLDDDPGRRAMGQALGAEAAPLALSEGRTPEELFEVVVDGSGDPAALGFAVRSCAPNGVLTAAAMYFSATTPLPLTRAYMRGFTLHTGRVQSRAVLPEVLACVACGDLHTEIVTHRTAGFDEAAEAMTDPGPKLVFLP